MARLAAVILAVFGLLPIANWIAGGHEAPWYGERLALWGSGLVIVLGLGVLLQIVLRRWPHLWREGLWHRVAGRWHRAGWKGDLLCALAALLTYALVAMLVFESRPIVIDEIIQLFQARIFASGQLWLPVPDLPALRSALFVVDAGTQLYGQFPAGGPAMLALGTLVGAEWLVGPAFGALSVLLLARLVRRIETAPGTALATVLLFGWAPFVVFMSGTFMNHVTTLTAVLAAGLALAYLSETDEPRPWGALACGLALGLAITIRPLDGIVFALPTAAWLILRLRRGAGHLTPLLASGVGIAVPLGALMYVNWQWTGSPLTFGYEALWGSGVGLGFGHGSWEVPHTPALGVELINLYVLRLQIFMFETPLPSLLFATAALGLSKVIRPFDRWVLWCIGLLLLGYFAYWHDGFHLGPRFMYPLTPWIALWTARLPGKLRDLGMGGAVERFAVSTGVIALGIGAAQLLPIRLFQYHTMVTSTPGNFEEAARMAGVHDATILVRESWGAQLIARLWALGVSRPATEEYYRTTDICALETAITTAEQSSGDASTVETLLESSRADSSRLVALAVSSDKTVRALPGSAYSARCMRRLREMEGGRTNWAPALLVQDSNVWMRDLHEVNAPVVDLNRPVWLLTRYPAPSGAPRFERVNIDSMRSDWVEP